jgi:hypothetical protein
MDDLIRLQSICWERAKMHATEAKELLPVSKINCAIELGEARAYYTMYDDITSVLYKRAVEGIRISIQELS